MLDRVYEAHKVRYSGFSPRLAQKMRYCWEAVENHRMSCLEMQTASDADCCDPRLHEFRVSLMSKRVRVILVPQKKLKGGH
jgi:hypothetical protein